MSAFVVHDLKNGGRADVAAAERMLSVTVTIPEFRRKICWIPLRTSRGRMQGLMSQLLEKTSFDQKWFVDIAETMRRIVQNRALRPLVQLTVAVDVGDGDAERPRKESRHIVQNALTRPDEDGTLPGRKRLKREKPDEASIIGVGMSEVSIREQLFKPFSRRRRAAWVGVP